MSKKLIGVISVAIILMLGIVTLGVIRNNNQNSNNSSFNNGNNNQEDKENNLNKDNNQDENDNNLPSPNNVVVIYFSATGTTKKVAISLSETLKSDLIEIIPEEKYTSSDLNYNDSNSRVSKEHNDSSSRPAIANIIDVSKYDTIYLGYPIWWGDAPRIIYSFLAKYDLSKKNLFLFSTSASSEITTSVNNLKNYQKDLNIKDSKRFSSSFTDKDINDFINKNNF